MSTATFLEIKPHIIWPFVTFLLGYLLGHWLSLGRDKRKEWNDFLPKAREMFHPIPPMTKKEIESGIICYARFDKIDDVLIEDLCGLMSYPTRWRFKRTYRKLQNLMCKDLMEPTQYYCYDQKDYEAVNKSVNGLLRFLKRK